MCDIYEARCARRGCKEKVEMHLADYDTGREEVRVFCGAHLPSRQTEGVLWKYRDGKDAWKKAFVRALTANARANEDGNHPNFAELVSAPAGALRVDGERAFSGAVPEGNRRPGRAALRKGRAGR